MRGLHVHTAMPSVQSVARTTLFTLLLTIHTAPSARGRDASRTPPLRGFLFMPIKHIVDQVYSVYFYVVAEAHEAPIECSVLREAWSESLADTEVRVRDYYNNAIVPQLRRKRTVLVSAHNNVIRTIIHHLEVKCDDLDAQLSTLEIPYATPLVYTFAAGPYGKLYPFADDMQRGCIRGTFLE